MRVLVVDDAPDIRLLAAYALEASGRFEVAAVDSGRAALDHLSVHPVDVVLCDLMMPNMDGVDFLGRCRQIRRCEQTPIVFLTASAEPGTEARLRQLGAGGLIAKPFDPESLAAQLACLLAEAPC